MTFLDDRKNRESCEYYYSGEAQLEARGMPPSFKKHGYAQPDRSYPEPLPRANLIIVREHLQNAMRAGLNSEALRCVVAAIKEIER